MRRWVVSGIIMVVLLVLWIQFFPPRFWLNWRKKVPVTPEEGAQLVEKYRCRMCHQIGGKGAMKAPSLDGITRRVKDPAKVPLRLWLKNPQAVKPTTNMPNFHLSDYEIEAILRYFESIDQNMSIDIRR